jgi:hypothetical protein
MAYTYPDPAHADLSFAGDPAYTYPDPAHADLSLVDTSGGPRVLTIASVLGASAGTPHLYFPPQVLAMPSVHASVGLLWIPHTRVLQFSGVRCARVGSPLLLRFTPNRIRVNVRVPGVRSKAGKPTL